VTVDHVGHAARRLTAAPGGSGFATAVRARWDGAMSTRAGAGAAVVAPRAHDTAQRRTVLVLGGVQVLAGIGIATGIAVSSLIAADLSGSDAIGGLAQTSAVVGAALVAMPLAQLAARFGRRRSLAFGHLVA